MRALPRLNEDVNEEWASDKTRHAVDGLLRNRLDRPWLRDGGKLRPASWDEAFARIAEVAKKAKGSVAAVAGDLVDVETMYAAKALVAALGSDLLEGRQTGLAYDTSSLAAVNFNTDHRRHRDGRRDPPRRHQPALGGEPRQHPHPQGGAGRGQGVRDRPRGRSHLPGRMARRRSLAARRSARCARAQAQRPAVIVGGAALKVPGGQAATLALVESLNLVRDGWNGYNVLHTAAARTGGLMLGYAQPGGMASLAEKAPKLLFLLGADEADLAAFAGQLQGLCRPSWRQGRATPPT